MAVLLTRENRAARPEKYKVRARVQATYASRTMLMTGLILLAFIIFHILHFTVRVVPENYNETIAAAKIEYNGLKLKPSMSTL